MKFLELFFQLFAQYGRAFIQDHTELAAQQVTARARKITILLTVTALSVTLLCFGFSHAFEAIVQSLENDSHWFTGRFQAGLGLMLFSLAGIFFALGKRRWNQSAEASNKPKQESALEGAAAVLLLEIANELRERRNHPETGATNERTEPKTHTRKAG